jgi:hypothetical protein
VSYDGRLFRSQATVTAAGDSTPTGHYHQSGDLVWAEFSGGAVRLGRLVGTAGPDGVLTAAYSQVLDDGRVVCGTCLSTPQTLPDGRVRLREDWTRTDGSRGTSWIEEVPRD